MTQRPEGSSFRALWCEGMGRYLKWTEDPIANREVGEFESPPAHHPTTQKRSEAVQDFSHHFRLKISGAAGDFANLYSRTRKLVDGVKNYDYRLG